MKWSWAATANGIDIFEVKNSRVGNAVARIASGEEGEELAAAICEAHNDTVDRLTSPADTAK